MAQGVTKNQSTNMQNCSREQNGSCGDWREREESFREGYHRLLSSP